MSEHEDETQPATDTDNGCGGGCGGCNGGCNDCTETKPCPKNTKWCAPEEHDLGPHVIGESDPCPEPEKMPVELCCCHTHKPCPVHLKLGLCYTKKGCDKHPCIDSIPPNLGCIPICAGVGQYDGGVPAWTNACAEGCDWDILQAKYPHVKKYIVPQGETLLDLNTHPEQTTRLHVHRGHTGQPINLREFLALSVKLFKTGMKLTNTVDPNSLSLNYVTAADGTMMLAIVSDGAAVGTGMALVPQYAADGTTVIGYLLPPAA